MEEDSREIAKIAIRDYVEIEEYINEMKLKKRKLKKIVYQYMKLNQIESIEEEKFTGRIMKRGLEIIVNRNEREI